MVARAKLCVAGGSAGGNRVVACFCVLGIDVCVRNDAICARPCLGVFSCLLITLHSSSPQTSLVPCKLCSFPALFWPPSLFGEPCLTPGKLLLTRQSPFLCGHSIMQTV